MGVGSVEEMQNKYYTHFRNGPESIHEPLDPPDNTFPSIRSVDRRPDVINAIETSLSLRDKGRLSLVLWHGSVTLGGKEIRWRQKVLGFGGLIGSPGMCGGRNFFGGSIVTSDRYVWGDIQRDPVRRYNFQVEGNRLCQLSGLSIAMAENKRNVYMWMLS